MSTTQEQGWASMQAALGHCQWLVWKHLAEHPGRTRNEIDRALAVGRPNANFSRRLAELERMGVVKRDGFRQCSVSGHPCDVWRAVVGVPDKSKARRAPSERQRLSATVKRIQEVLAGPGGLMPDPRIEAIRKIIDSDGNGATT